MSKSMKRIVGIICLAACAVLAIFGVKGLLGGGGSSSPTEAKNSVVYIREQLVDYEGNSGWASGTGWMIGAKGEAPQYVVTNAHVVSDFQEVKNGTSQTIYAAGLSVYFSAAENDYVSPQIVYYSPIGEKDIAVLKLPSPTDKRVPLPIRPSDGIQPGDEVYAIGFPGISNKTQDYITYDADDATLTKGIISKITNSYLTTGDMFELDAVINHGNSGGPLVDAKGNAIGINESISQETVLTLDDYGNVTTTPVSNDLGYAITSNELLKVLDSEKIPYTLAGGSSMNMGSIIFLILAAVALVAALIFLLSKGGQKTAPAMAGAAAAGGAAAGGAAAYASAPAASYGAVKRPVLRGVAGQYAGQTIAVAGRLTIGRNAAVANVVFDKDAPGVSGNHCSLTYDAAQDAFLLTDNGSSYGTFLENDKKLAAGVPVKLHAGEGFYLANRGTRFLVTME